MNNNIVSFNAVSTLKSSNVNTVSANKNIINISLANSSLYKTKENNGVFDENITLNLGENVLKEYTLEELLAEGLENKQKTEEQRQKALEVKIEAERESKLKELEELYNERKDNNGLFYPKKEAAIEKKIIDLEKELNISHKPDGWENFCDTAEEVGATAVTFTASVVEGVVDVAETIIDGAVQVGGGIIAYGVGLIDEDAGNTMKQGIQNFVSYDASGTLYDKFVEVSGIDEDIAYGWAHTAGTLAGQVVGYAAITVATGGAATVALSGLAAAGSSAETAYANGASFDEAFVSSIASGTIGAVAGGGMDKLGAIAKGASTLKGVIGYTSVGMAVGALEPVSNSLVEYATYGNDMYDSFGEYYKESGGILNTVIGTLAGGLSVGGQSLSGYKSNTKNVDLNNINQSYKPSAISQTNSVKNYNFDRDGYINHVNDLLNQGYNDDQIISTLAEYGNRCSEIQNKLAFSDFTYEYLISRGYDPKDAAIMIKNTYDDILINRGMTTVYIDKNGIKYNMINDFNQSNQAYDMNFINQQIQKLPQQVRNNITEINIYDTFNPADYYWNNTYNSTGNYFRSAATGGNGTINLWANDFVDSSTIPHEAGHCFDVNRQFSESKSYLEAMYNDKMYNGLESVTEYGKNNSCEDFAESMAAYLGEKNGVDINNFPNRKAYFDKIFNVSNSVLTAEGVNNLNKVTNILSEKYGSQNVTKVYYEYLTTGNINKITRTGGARDIISKMDINEVLEYYNIINGG